MQRAFWPGRMTVTGLHRPIATGASAGTSGTNGRCRTQRDAATERAARNAGSQDASQRGRGGVPHQYPEAGLLQRIKAAAARSRADFVRGAPAGDASAGVPVREAQAAFLGLV